MTAAVLTFNRRAFASLHLYRNYRLFFVGQVISVTGTWMHRVAQAWLVLTLTKSPFAVGVLALAQFLPFTVFGLFSGVFVDRLNPRRIVIATQAIQMVLATIIAGIALAGIARPWHVYVIAALLGMTQVLDAPARQALTYEMVGRAELPNAVALNSSLFNASRIFGPAVAGVLIATVGVGICFALNAVSYVAVLGALLAMRSKDFFALQRQGRPPIFAGIREGLGYVRHRPRALVVLALVTTLSTFGFNFNVLLPVLAKHTLHSGSITFGILSAVFGAGAVIGALAAAALGRASMKILLAATGGFAVSELVLAPQHTIGAAAALLFVTGLCFTIWTSSSNTTLQLDAPDHLRGRIVGLYYYAFNGLVPIGGLLTGWLASRGGTVLSFYFAGTVGLVATAGAAAYLYLREREPAEAAPVEAALLEEAA